MAWNITIICYCNRVVGLCQTLKDDITVLGCVMTSHEQKLNHETCLVDGPGNSAGRILLVVQGFLKVMTIHDHISSPEHETNLPL